MSGVMILLAGSGQPTGTPSPVRQVLGQTAIAASAWQASGTQRDGMSGTTKHPILATVKDPVFVWRIETPYLGTGATSTGTMRAAVWTSENTTPVPLTFSGASTVTAPTLGTITSDAASMTLPKGANMFMHVWMDVTGDTGAAPASTPNTVTGYDLGTTVGTWEASLAGNYIGSGVGNLPTLRPVGVYAPSDADSWVMTGTSIAYASESFLDKVARALGWASTKMAMGGEAFRNFPANWDARYGDTLNKYTHLLCEHGANDVSTNPLATIQADAIRYWGDMRAAGIQYIHQTTTLPQTTGDQSTVEGQTVKAFEAVRVAWNTWLRDGAPMNGTNPAAVGDGGAVRAGETGHLLAAIHDTTSAVETAQNSGKWKAGIGGDGVHPNATAHALIADYLTPRLASA